MDPSTCDPASADAVLDRIPAAILVLDGERRVLGANHTAEEWTGLSLAEMRGRPGDEFLASPGAEPGAPGWPGWKDGEWRAPGREPRSVEWRESPLAGPDAQTVIAAVDVPRRPAGRDRLAAVRRIERTVLGAPGAAEAIEAALGPILALTGSQWAIVCCAIEEGSPPLVAYGEAPASVEIATLDEFGPTMAEILVQTAGEEARVLADLQPGSVRELLPRSARAVLSVPIEGGGRRCGCAVLGSARRSNYGASDLADAADVARCLADAIRRAAAREALEWRLAEAEARLAERAAEMGQIDGALSALADSLGRELTAPARALAGLSEALLDELGESIDDAGREGVRRIGEAGRRLVELVEEVGAFARLAGFRFEPEAVSLDDAVEAARARIEPAEPRARFEVEGPLGTVRAHRATLAGAVTRILEHAVRLVPPLREPRVRVRSELVGPAIRLWIADNGADLPAEERERLFDLFERPEAGFSLGTARKAIEKMGGRVGVEAAPGHGNRFWIDLPGA